MTVPTVTLPDGVEMPRVGFGVFQVPPAEAADVVSTALDAGYRSIDTAAIYGNEEGVGEAIARSGLPRDELFVTTKLWNSDQGYDSTLRAFDESMRKLGLEVLDLYLIHWPVPARDAYVDTWRAFQRLHAEGRVRAIGVSNFQRSHLDRLAAESDAVPAVNQIELHPLLPQAELRGVHAERGIVTEAWSPLAKGGDLLADPLVTRIAEAHGKTPAQVLLRWHLELGNVVIPKSVTPERIRANLQVVDFALTAEDMTALVGLESGTRTGPDPDTFNVT
ncbi:MAG: aldo/keto reductase [Actinomycetota bacterium]|jgi:2,5-diketo-D-gluconate reductase A|nr:aldo/keto reductase [Actinomycetota bacterium]